MNKDLIKKFELAEKLFADKKFEKSNFTGSNLTIVDFMGATLIEANFQNSLQ